MKGKKTEVISYFGGNEMANQKQFLNVNDIVSILGKDVTSLTDLTYAYNSGKAAGFNVTGKLNDTMLDVDDVLVYLTMLK